MKVIIIDDEPLSVELLSRKLSTLFPRLQVVAQCHDSDTGIASINTLQPDVVFLDVEMPGKNGFQVLDEIAYEDFFLIFITAYDEYALKAFKYNAIEYLLKPFDSDELIRAVQKAEKQYLLTRNHSPLLKEGISRSSLGKIALPYQAGTSLVPVCDIIFCESDNNYTHIFTSDKRRFTVVKSLKEVQDSLSTFDFMRIHRKYLINLNHVVKIYKNDNLYLTLTNGKDIPVSRQQKEELMKHFDFL